MELLQLLLPALFFVSVFSIPYVKVMLGDPFILPGNCPTNIDGKLRQTQPQSRDVATRLHGVWTPGESFRDRISPNSSVFFNSSVYTDSGLYVFMCGGREVSEVQVEVVVFAETSVTEGEALSLSCYYPTTAGTCWSVRWVKDGKDVLKEDSCGADWLSHGDLSLNLQRARREDRGDYFCYIQAKGGLPLSGTPAAARLKVSERSPDQTTSTPPLASVSLAQTTTEVNGLGTPAAVATAVGCLIVGAVFGCLMTYFCLRRASGGLSEGRTSEVERKSLNPARYVNGCHQSDTSHV
ncbi:hypothetical protein ACER0C_001259 [Sarotherodon galilaeus]